MKKLKALVVLAALGPALVAPVVMAQGVPNLTREVLVLNLTAVKMTSDWANRGAVEILNLGPNDLWCAVGSSSMAVINKSRRVDRLGGSWAIDLRMPNHIWCKAGTADQATGAGTIVTEVP